MCFPFLFGRNYAIFLEDEKNYFVLMENSTNYKQPESTSSMTFMNVWIYINILNIPVASSETSCCLNLQFAVYASTVR